MIDKTEQSNYVIVNDVIIIDKGNGLSSFIPVNEKSSDVSYADTSESGTCGFWGWVKSLFTKKKVQPYAIVRDLADPFNKRKSDPNDYDVRSDGKNAIEIGLKFTL